MQECALTVCGVLVGRAACAEDKLFWWLERELKNKIKHRYKNTSFFFFVFSQKQDLSGLAIIKVNPIPDCLVGNQASCPQTPVASTPRGQK